LFAAAFAKRTVDQDKRVYSEFRRMCNITGSQSKGLEYCLERWGRLKPPTTIRAIRSLSKLQKFYGAQKGMYLEPNWSFLALRAARRKAAAHQPTRAVPANATMISALLTRRSIPARVKLLACLTLVSASRFDDLTRPTTKITVRSKDTIRVHLPVDKGQPFGRRAVKWLRCPNLIHRFSLQPRTRLRLNMSYHRFRRYMLKIRKGKRHWTGHSGRRGACTLLSGMGFSLRRIQALTLHSGSDAKALESVRQYVEISRHMPEARRQMRMAERLDRLIRA
jgi:hypothetical protein